MNMQPLGVMKGGISKDESGQKFQVLLLEPLQGMLECRGFMFLMRIHFTHFDHVLQVKVPNKRALSLVLARELIWKTEDLKMRPFDEKASVIICEALVKHLGLHTQLQSIVFLR
jgi:hypothetical protein